MNAIRELCEQNIHMHCNEFLFYKSVVLHCKCTATFTALYCVVNTSFSCDIILHYNFSMTHFYAQYFFVLNAQKQNKSVVSLALSPNSVFC